MKNNIILNRGYSEVNGLSMYYEMYGQGKPFVLIHGGGSTIQTSFGNIIPHLAKHRQIVAVELQAHGRTNDRNTNLTFKQDADDVATLLKNLAITKADFLGFSNGGHTAIEIAIHYPDIVDRLILCSAFYKRNAVVPQFWEGFNQVDFSNMPQALKDGYLSVNNNPDGLINMFYKDIQRMKVFTDWSDEQMKSIQAATLIMNSSEDVGSPEHAIEMHRTIPNSDLAILPGRHGAYLGAIEYLENGKWNQTYAVDIIEEFLNNKTKFKPTMELTGDMYLENDKVLRLNRDGRFPENDNDVRGMINLFVGSSYHPNQSMYLSFVAGPGFIRGQTRLGIKPSFGFYFSKNQKWTGKVSYVNIFNRTKIVKEDFGSLSLAIGVRLF